MGGWTARQSDGRQVEANAQTGAHTPFSVPQRGASVGVAHASFLVWGRVGQSAGNGSRAPSGDATLHCDVGERASAVSLHLGGR